MSKNGKGTAHAEAAARRLVVQLRHSRNVPIMLGNYVEHKIIEAMLSTTPRGRVGTKLPLLGQCCVRA